MKLFRFAVIGLFVLSLGGVALADHHEAAGFRAEMTTQLGMIGDKNISLAEAMPEDKFSWRPAEGVRSAGESYVHAVAANYFLLSLIGQDIPEGLNPREMEKTITSKADIIQAMKDSYAYTKEAVGKITDEDLDRGIKLFGQDATVRFALMLVIEHNSEHLGQSIAYARMNGVVPPWSLPKPEEKKKEE